MSDASRSDPTVLLGLAVEAARRAGALLLELATERESLRQGSRTKTSLTDLVSQADLDSEALLLAHLLAARPDDGVLGEEGSDRPGTSGVVWVVDPIDGTTNFLYGYGSFAVSIAATTRHSTLAGVVYDPLRDELFAASAGGGATLGGERLRVGAPPPLAEALIATGFGYRQERRRAQGELVARVLPAVRDVRRSGTASLDLCALACGRVDAYYESGLAPWDEAAGALIAEEAGCAVVHSSTIDPDATTLVAAPPTLLPDLLDLLGHGREAR